MEDVLAVYERPYDPKRPVVCAGQSNKELHKTPRGILPAETGQVARQDYEYERNSTANMFMTVEPLIGKRRVRITDRRTKQDFAKLLRCLSDDDYPDVDIIIPTRGLLILETALQFQNMILPSGCRVWHQHMRNFFSQKMVGGDDFPALQEIVAQLKIAHPTTCFPDNH